ncbi:fluoride efflux transporter CrcB [Actinopolymorpha alba]|uniref:fluoride efflux transporter CrcB n=1 Tax=Actinopolymorpha alba TaxID=533267 RepID=UPI00036C18D3|nr:fluoride efflux transporter CrcB [Actinopolymorpha alba]
MTAVLAVVLGGLIGAPLRYHLDRAIQTRHESAFPWGTLTVNVLGSFLLGVIASATESGVLGALGAPMYALVGTGLCGALTTFSTFGYETLRLLEDGARLPAVANVGVSLLAGLGAAFAGFAIGMAVWSGG